MITYPIPYSIYLYTIYKYVIIHTYIYILYAYIYIRTYLYTHMHATLNKCTYSHYLITLIKANLRRTCKFTYEMLFVILFYSGLLPFHRFYVNASSTQPPLIRNAQIMLYMHIYTIAVANVTTNFVLNCMRRCKPFIFCCCYCCVCLSYWLTQQKYFI